MSIQEDDRIKKQKEGKYPKNNCSQNNSHCRPFDVLMPRIERDGECIHPDVEFGTVEVKRMVIYFLVIIDIGTHFCSSLRWA